MGTILFQLPADLDQPARQELERAYVVAGMDGMPVTSRAQIKGDELTVQYPAEESGCIAIPWRLPGGRRLLLATPTLSARSSCYRLLVELARGKVSQLRTQIADWQTAGLGLEEERVQSLKLLSAAFARIVSLQDRPAEADSLAAETLPKAVGAAEALARFFARQLLRLRQERQPRLDTALGCALSNAVPSAEQTQWLRQTFTSVRLPFTWSQIEPSSGTRQWDGPDALTAWARGNGLSAAGGPLIDFSPDALPSWLSSWQKDLQSVANFMGDYVGAVIERYRADIQSWQVTTGTNLPYLQPYSEEQRLWLTARLLQAAKKADPNLQLAIGIAQPWGEYVPYHGQTHSPMLFADMLMRAGVGVAAIALEIVMGVHPHGSHERDLLDLSKLLDTYSILGAPLHISFGYPSTGDSPDDQPRWAEDVTAIALSKPYIQSVEWAQWTDAGANRLPSCGLIDAHGKQKPALENLRRLREAHLS